MKITTQKLLNFIIADHHRKDAQELIKNTNNNHRKSIQQNKDVRSFDGIKAVAAATTTANYFVFSFSERVFYSIYFIPLFTLFSQRAALLLLLLFFALLQQINMDERQETKECVYFICINTLSSCCFLLYFPPIYVCYFLSLSFLLAHFEQIKHLHAASV